MKKILLTLIYIFSVCSYANAQNSWTEQATEFVNGINREIGQTFQQELEPHGIKATVSAEYITSSKELVMDIRFQQAEIWDSFNSDAMKAAKQEMIAEYKQNYKTDQDFKEFIQLMQQNGAKFKIIYSCNKGGNIKTKEFTITPKEII